MGTVVRMGLFCLFKFLPKDLMNAVLPTLCFRGRHLNSGSLCHAGGGVHARSAHRRGAGT